jgi:casein kinase 1
LRNNEEVAIKMVNIYIVILYKESSKSRHPQLSYETKILKFLQGGVGIPNVHYYCISGDYNFMILDLLGPSIEDLLCSCDRKFSLKTSLMIADQMVNIKLKL